MVDRTIFRLQDIDDAITQIEALLNGKSFDDLQSDRVMRAAFERFLEIISEASRHIPDELTATAPEIPWRRVGDIGNHLRHAYNRVEAQILWSLHANSELKSLQRAIVKFIGDLDSPR